MTKSLRHVPALPLTLCCLALAASVVLGTGCNTELDEISSGKFVCATNDDCTSGFACAPDRNDPDTRLCQSSCSVPADCSSDGSSTCTSAGVCAEVAFSGSDGSGLEGLCTLTAGPVNDPNVVLLGAITPIGIDDAQSNRYTSRWQAIELAVNFFNESRGADERKIAVVGCDDIGDETRAVRAAEHLALTLGVPAIIGPHFSTNFDSVADRVAVPDEPGTLVISPSATAASISGLGDRVWRVVPSDIDQAGALLALIRRWPSSALPGSSARPLDLTTQKVWVLTQEGLYGSGFREEINKAVDFYGFGCGAESCLDAFVSSTYDSTSSAASIVSGNLNDTIGAVVIAGASDQVADIINEIVQVRRMAGGTPPAFFIADGGRRDSVLNLAVTLQGEGIDLASQLVGTFPGQASRTTIANFNDSFRAAYNSEPNTYSAHAYDATLVVGLAMSEIPAGTPVTGNAIADNMTRLNVPGTEGTIDITSSSGISDALQKLSGGNSVDLDGASGSLDFTPFGDGNIDQLTSWYLDTSSTPPGFVNRGTFSRNDDREGRPLDWMPSAP